MEKAELMVTLWPSMPHFARFADDGRLSGIRLNSAMVSLDDLDRELPLIPEDLKVPLYFDIKGRQLRVTEVKSDPDFTDVTLNHPIRVNLPTPVLFKGGTDRALMVRLWDGETCYGDVSAPPPPHTWFQKFSVQLGPKFLISPGESLYIRDRSLEVGGGQFTQVELAKIERVKKAGFTKWFLSYVQCKRDVDEFRELVGKDAEVMLKVEDRKGMEYVAREFKKRDNLKLVAAKGDLYVELDKPHDILEAQKLIIEKDKEACAGSRMMLSVIDKEHTVVDGKVRSKIICNPVPSDADFEQLAWLYEIGYRNYMLCDEMCLHEDLLDAAVNATCAFMDAYAK